MQFFCHQKKRKVKLDKVREGLRPITLRFRANARKLILGSIGTPLGYHIWSKELLMQATLMMTLMEVKGHQRSNMVTYGKICAMATIFGQNSC